MCLFYKEATCKAVQKNYFFTHLTLKNTRKGCWVISPNYRPSHPGRFCTVRDDSCSKLWCPSGLTLRCMPYGRGTLKNPLQRILFFIARKACTIALSKAQGTRQSTLFMSLEIPWGFLTQAVLRSLARLISRKKVGERSLVVSPLPGFLGVSCFEKPTRSVPEIWGRTYNVLPWSAKGTRNGTRNWIPIQPRKAQRN